MVLIWLDVFDPGSGGIPENFQHFFWFFGHFEAYLFLLKIFIFISGTLWLSHLLLEKKRYAVFSIFIGLVIAFCLALIMSFLKIQTMYATGEIEGSLAIPRSLFLIFNMAVYAIAILTAKHWLKPVLSILSPLRENTVAGLFAITTLIISIMVFVVYRDLINLSDMSYLRDTYYINAHLKMSALFVGMSLLLTVFFNNFSKLFGVDYSGKLSVILWGLTSIALILLVLPDFIMVFFKPGLDYNSGSFDMLNHIAFAGVCLSAISLCLFFCVLLEALFRRNA